MLDQKTIPLLERRVLLKRLLQAGLLGGAGLETLTSCDFSLKSPTTIHWLTNGDNNGTLKQLADYFNRINPDGIVVGTTPGTNHDTLVGKFRNQDSTFDLVSLDIPWMAEFINQHWLKSLDDYWPMNSEQPRRTDYLDKPLQICSHDGQLWAAPLHTDVGILYYRTDSPDNLIQPSNADNWTWYDLIAMAQQAQKSQWCSGGFLWEASWVAGAGQEGLMCLFLEILDGFGGQLFDSADNPQKVLINSPEAVDALEHMKIWNTTISAYTTERGQKKKATDSNGNDCATAWKEGHAAFMRNWPDFIAVSDNAHNPVAGNYSVAPLPRRVHAASGPQKAAQYTRSCLGGYQLAINTYSNNKVAAWKFIKWMLEPVAQQYLAYNESFTVTLKSIYDDPYINRVNPHYKPLLEIVNNAQHRPLLPNYQTAVAAPVQAIVNRMLTDDGYTPERAVQDLERAMRDALHKK